MTKNIESYLKNKNYVYEDLDSTDEARYKKVLYKLDISSDDIKEPTIIYVSEGKIYSSLVNVEDMENFETYISNLENSWSWFIWKEKLL